MRTTGERSSVDGGRQERPEQAHALRSRVRQPVRRLIAALAVGIGVAAVVVSSVVGLDDWADAVATAGSQHAVRA